MKIHLEAAGALLVLLAALHGIFPRYFEWKKSLGALPQVSREIMYVHTFFIALTVLLMGLLCLTSADQLLASDLGRRILAGLAVFWTARLLVQFFGYSADLWRGKRLETTVHIVFSALWLYFTTVFWLAALGG